MANNKSPAGSARNAPPSNGRPGGSHSVVTRYVLPHTTGASAVTNVSHIRCLVSSLIASPFRLEAIASTQNSS
jgi:hypothetical protein